MKKIFTILLITAMVLSLGATAFAEEQHEITGAEFPLYFGQIDVGEKIKLYFMDGAEDLPYMDVGDWLPLMNLTLGDSKMGVSFTAETDGPIVSNA